jgi:cysteinyl-tRNA synthetase
MALRFYNTMTRRKQEFEPLESGHVRMYTCGPTVYFYAHIGNFRTYIFEDLLRRYLEYKGYRVTQVLNLTDVDDKTIRNSQKEGVSLNEFTAKYIEGFFRDLDTLNIERAEVYPRATEHINEMVALIKRLIEKGNTYEADGSIYYRISSFSDYGKLAGLDPSTLKVGARVDSDEYEKEDARDFALWKAWTPDDGDVFWETELGKGRPGWHIECSAMSMKYLGETFDIHTGSEDNIFPHHQNEIAQSEAATGKTFSRFWIHSRWLVLESGKMSKSLGNFTVIPDLLKKGYSPRAIRYALMSVHYRQRLVYGDDTLDVATSTLERIDNLITNLRETNGSEVGEPLNDLLTKTVTDFEAHMDDDLNIAPALGALFTMMKAVNVWLSEGRVSQAEGGQIIDILKKLDKVLGVMSFAEDIIDKEIQSLIEERTEARKRKHWAEADRIRKELEKRGIILQDRPEGTIWRHEKLQKS